MWFFKFFYFEKVALQCWDGFCCSVMQISHNYTHIPSFVSLPPLPSSDPSRSLQCARLSSLCHTAASHQLSAFHMVVCICQCYSLNSSHALLSPLCPQVCSLRLRLHSFPANRFISTVFLDSIHMLMHIYIQAMFVFLFLTLLRITGSSFIPLTTTYSNSYFFMAE